MEARQSNKSGDIRKVEISEKWQGFSSGEPRREKAGRGILHTINKQQSRGRCPRESSRGLEDNTALFKTLGVSLDLVLLVFKVTRVRMALQAKDAELGLGGKCKVRFYLYLNI